MKTIEVIIHTNGINAREVNSYSEIKPKDDTVYTKGEEIIKGKEREYLHNAVVSQWEKTEKELRVFEIDLQEEELKPHGGNEEFEKEGSKLVSAHIIYEPNSKQKAIILPSGKIKIIPNNGEFHESFSKKMNGVTVIENKIYFGYTKIGEPNFIKKESKFADKSNSISLQDWTADELEAMAKFMRENPLTKLFSDGSGNV